MSMRSCLTASPFIGLEFFPPAGALVEPTLDRAAALVRRVSPSAVSLAPRVGSTAADVAGLVDACAQLQERCSVPVMLHLTCHMSVPELTTTLAQMRARGVTSVLALRGDNLPPHEPGRLRHASELVALIRSLHADAFVVGVAGYPEVHPDAWNHASLPPSQLAARADVRRTAEKVRAGADFVVSQFTYDTEAAAAWLAALREEGVNVPVIAGYLPIQAYAPFRKITHWMRLRVPHALRQAVEVRKDDDAAVSALGIDTGAAHCRAMMAAGFHGVLFHTLNLTHATSQIVAAMRGQAPSSTERPDFPNGRYSRLGSPFGELTEYYAYTRRSRVDRKAWWGTPQSLEDVSRVFVAYLDGRVPELPWCDSRPDPETEQLSEMLRWVNRRGFLTISSQPRVNGVESDHPRFGWGGAGGFVYQKAYLEFFCSPDALDRLKAVLPRYPSLSMHAFDAGTAEFHSTSSLRANAVTWGVFDGREIIQTTVIDPSALRVWKTAALAMWHTDWISLYSGSSAADVAARTLLHGIASTWWLVNLVDNDFVSPSADIFEALREVITDAMTEEELRLRVRDLETQLLRLGRAQEGV